MCGSIVNACTSSRITLPETNIARERMIKPKQSSNHQFSGATLIPRSANPYSMFQSDSLFGTLHAIAILQSRSSTRPWRAFFSVNVEGKARVALGALTCHKTPIKTFRKLDIPNFYVQKLLNISLINKVSTCWNRVVDHQQIWMQALCRLCMQPLRQLCKSMVCTPSQQST